MSQAMSGAMTFARRVFLVAGAYGILTLVPQYFLESKNGADYPPPITHPEYYYGFVGVALAWQIVFLVIAKDPAAFRPLMIPAVLEKATFSLAVFALYARGRVAEPMVAVAAVDFTLGILFTISYVRMGRAS